MKAGVFFIGLFICGTVCAQDKDSGFNPLKELQTVPNASRITVTVDRLQLFNTTRRIAILLDGKRVADGDSDNPATYEPEPGKEFFLEICAVTRNGDIIPHYCVFGGVMRPTDNTLYRINYKINQGVNYLVFMGKQSF